MPLESCINDYTSNERVDGVRCAMCGALETRTACVMQLTLMANNDREWTENRCGRYRRLSEQCLAMEERMSKLDPRLAKRLLSNAVQPPTTPPVAVLATVNGGLPSTPTTPALTEHQVPRTCIKKILLSQLPKVATQHTRTQRTHTQQYTGVVGCRPCADIVPSLPCRLALLSVCPLRCCAFTSIGCTAIESCLRALYSIAHSISHTSHPTSEQRTRRPSTGPTAIDCAVSCVITVDRSADTTLATDNMTGTTGQRRTRRRRRRPDWRRGRTERRTQRGEKEKEEVEERKEEGREERKEEKREEAVGEERKEARTDRVASAAPFVPHLNSVDRVWVHVSDDEVRRVSWREVANCEAYMLFYEKEICR